MYESFFGLSRRPFAATADADCYFPAMAIEAARQTIFRTIDRGEGAALLIGPAGAGKSLLLEVLVEQFRDRFDIALLSNGRLNTRRELLQAIMYALSLPYRDLEEGELRLGLIDHLSAVGAPHEGLLLLIDEAHTLPLKVLEELRLITNLVRGGVPKVRLLLAGSPALEERFTSPKLDTFNQRITARCYLQAFDRSETREYVKAQLEWAGRQGQAIFDVDALDAVYQATQGTPRLVNQLCDYAMLAACAAGNRVICKAEVEGAWADLQQLPTPWNRDTDVPPASAPPGDVIEFGVLDDAEDGSVDAFTTGGFESLSIDEQEDLSAGDGFGDSATGDMIIEIGGEYSGEASYAPAPNRARPAGEAFGHSDPLQQLANVERQIAAINGEYDADSPFASQIELSFGASTDPFSETFAEEELVIDPFAMTTTDALANRPLVQSEEGRRLGALLKPLPESMPPMLSVAVSAANEDLSGDNESLEFETWPEANGTGAHSDYAPPPIIRWPADDEGEGDAGNNGPRKSGYRNTPDEATHAIHAPGDIGQKESSEPELIVIEDESPTEPRVTVVRRGQYRQLFSNLRRG